MKITKVRLNQIIKEELAIVLDESDMNVIKPGAPVATYEKVLQRTKEKLDALASSAAPGEWREYPKGKDPKVWWVHVPAGKMHQIPGAYPPPEKAQQ
tara:strand:+ start:518 stop:808 length:291 start_codon:yes stop_codon:yes gene_type:complete